MFQFFWCTETYGAIFQLCLVILVDMAVCLRIVGRGHQLLLPLDRLNVLKYFGDDLRCIGHKPWMATNSSSPVAREHYLMRFCFVWVLIMTWATVFHYLYHIIGYMQIEKMFLVALYVRGSLVCQCAEYSGPVLMQLGILLTCFIHCFVSPRHGYSGTNISRHEI